MPEKSPMWKKLNMYALIKMYVLLQKSYKQNDVLAIFWHSAKTAWHTYPIQMSCQKKFWSSKARKSHPLSTCENHARLMFLGRTGTMSETGHSDNLEQYLSFINNNFLKHF